MEIILLLSMFCWFHIGSGLPMGNKCTYSWDWDSNLGHRLNRHVIGFREGVSLLQCIRLCLNLDSEVCRSINYHKGSRKCELNSQDKRLEPGSLNSETGWNYYHKRIHTPQRSTGFDGNHCFIPKCGPETFEINNKCVEFNKRTHGSYQVNKQGCRVKYGSLVKVNTDAKWNKIVSEITSGWYYIGLKRSISGVLMWEDGETVDVGAYFANSQPDDFDNPDGPEDCGGIEMFGDYWGINDIPCNLNWYSVCEYDLWVYSLW